MARSLPLSQVSRLSDMTALDRNVTQEEIAAWARVDDRFGLATVGEAVLSRVPDAVTWWLTSPQVRQEWLEELWLQEGLHQLAWFRLLSERGTEDGDTQRMDRRLAAIRQRRQEAYWIQMQAVPVQEGRDAVELAALRRLRQAHRPELEDLEQRLAPAGGVPGEALTPEARRLLALPDEVFRDYVASDVQGQADGDDLAHPAVMPRWLAALNELGTSTCARLGVENPSTLAGKWFVIPDQHLMAHRRNAADGWMDRLTFLTHLRVRLAERRRLARLHGAVRYRHWYRLVDDQLIGLHAPEYATYLREEREKAEKVSPVPLPPHPAAFEEHAQVLAEHGWTVYWIFDGHRVWLDAHRGLSWRRDGRLIVTAARRRTSSNQKGTGRYQWRGSKEIQFVYHPRHGRRYLLLNGPEAMVNVAQYVPKRCPGHLVRGLVPQTWEHLKACVPPDGFRWRHPYPGDVVGGSR